MNVVDVEQGSTEWMMARCGSLGASVVHEAVARTKTGWGASRANRMAVLVVEQLNGFPCPTYESAAMRAGTEREPEARLAYELRTNLQVDTIGLVRHPTIEGTHASPDGLIGDDGLVEIKCPQLAQHLATIRGEPIASDYWIQMQWQMACTGRLWCDFVSYNPEFRPSMRLDIRRVHRDEKLIAALEEDIAQFLREARDIVSEVLQRFEPEAPIVMKHLNILVAG